MNTPLLVAGVIFAVLAALVHVYIFVLESVRWTKPATWKIFGLASQADAETTRLLAYNQGFYNLLLAVGVAVGALLLGPVQVAGVTLIIASTTSMVLAAVVLITSSPTSLRAALVQGLLPLISLMLVTLSLAI